MALTPVTLMVPGSGDPNGPWRKGPAISADDCKHGRGGVERIRVSDVFGQRGGPVQAAGRPAASKPEVAVMAFGKHKGRPLSSIQDEDPGYWRWAIANVGGFEAKARKAGLLDEDAGMDEQDDCDDGDVMTVNR